MLILRMEDEHLQEVRDLDYLVFQRNTPRTILNLKNLKTYDKDGCFVCIINKKVVGYIFARTFGQEGFLGPAGVHPEFQGIGIGKELINKSIDYLKTKCKVIGLEVLPEKTKNIEIYHRLGFVSALPSYIFDISSNDIDTLHKFNNLDLYKVGTRKREDILNSIDKLNGLKASNVSYRNDLLRSISCKGSICVTYVDRKLCGFFAYSRIPFPFIWGIVEDGSYDYNVLKECLANLFKYSGYRNCKIIVNTRYKRAVELLIKLNCKLDKSINRMLLKGYEGNYLTESKALIFRPWIS
ncbi:MAG: GNAT family N-acetyltransferase [Bacillota bacterium]|nr:GNAT family N-acetyltransferase [Bacillota bacterium]